MEIIVKGVIVRNLIDIEVFSIKVNELKYKIIRKRLELEHKKIIDIMKELKKQGEIKSISRPKNKKIQKQLNNLLEANKEIKKSIKKISEIFYK